MKLWGREQVQVIQVGQIHMTRRAALGLGLILSLPGLICGCGKSGPKTYDVSGSVTFAGKPIPDGWVCFSPDSSKGNSGPQGRARILNGKYDTDEDFGMGTIGGPMLVRIDGFDGNKKPDAPNGNPIMAPYNTVVDLPKDDAEAIDLVIPDAWAKKKVLALPP